MSQLALVKRMKELAKEQAENMALTREQFKKQLVHEEKMT